MPLSPPPALPEAASTLAVLGRIASSPGPRLDVLCVAVVPAKPVSRAVTDVGQQPVRKSNDTLTLGDNRLAIVRLTESAGVC
mmetsp:Transcript_118412/g.166442  ORF Transcript_118412/g.166442 Transcript_118412/m.166442 type:complete len:82 (-) Transcript_118412:240-485(-)